MNTPGATETNGPWDEELLDRKLFPRTPWHDVHMVVEGQCSLDVSYNFIQRWNHATQGTGTNNSWLIVPESSTIFSLPSLLKPSEFRSKATCQIVRSVGPWSTGQVTKEESVSRAYETLISSAQKFIFIENQYFITGVRGAVPANRIGRALYNRLKVAITRSELFRVIVILPVCPSGDLLSPSTRYVLGNIFNTIDRGPKDWSLLGALQEDFPDVDLSQFISFHCLRNYGFTEEVLTENSVIVENEQDISSSSSSSSSSSFPSFPPLSSSSSSPLFEGDLADDWALMSEKKTRPRAVTEQIYVHAKLMIVDDRHTIIGSANINDRSLLGNRDSELCIVISDPPDELETVTWGNEPHEVGSFSRSLRLKLYRDYLGLSSQDSQQLISDPVCQEGYALWRQTSKNNTKIFNEVFPSLPDSLTSLKDLYKLHEKGLYPGIVSRPGAAQSLQQISGFLVDFPYNFLRESSLGAQISDVAGEYFVPEETFL